VCVRRDVLGSVIPQVGWSWLHWLCAHSHA
jgi:hypothetical protein